MKIFMVQSIGGFVSETDTAGGVLHGVWLAKQWTSMGHEVHFITNARDRGEEVYSGIPHIYRLHSMRSDAESSIISFMLDTFVNYFLQFRDIEKIIRDTIDVKVDSIFLTTSPYLSDILHASRVNRIFDIPSVVYMHHITPPPWERPSPQRPPVDLFPFPSIP